MFAQRLQADRNPFPAHVYTTSIRSECTWYIEFDRWKINIIHVILNRRHCSCRHIFVTDCCYRFEENVSLYILLFRKL